MAIRVDTAFQAVYIHEPLGHTVPALNTAWTVAGLYRLEADVNQDSLIVGLYGTTSAANWVGLYMNADGINCRLEGYNGGSPVVSGDYTLEVGREYRLAIDYNAAGTVRMLIDGVQALSLSFTPNAGTLGERSLQWGGYGELAGYTDCTIARWRMWTAVLTEAEHRREYRSTVPFRTRNLIHDWPMDAGSGRFNDTLPGQPDLADNPTFPCGDGTDFTYRPSLVNAPQVIDLGTTTAPGARTINVPEWAEYVAVHIIASDDTASPYADLASIASDFAGSFSNTGNAAIATAAGGWVCTAPVANWASGRSVTIAFTQTNTLAGAHAFVYFMQDTAGVTARGYGQASGDGTTAGVASASGLADGLSVALDTRLNATSGSFPGNESGWSSILTGESTGSLGYWASSRLRSKPITLSGTESATTQTTYAGPITLVTWAPASLKTVAPTVAFPVAGDVTASGSNTASGSWAVSFPAAVAGDLLTVNLAWDDSTTVTAVTPPAGPNGETATAIVSAVASSGTEVRAQAWRYIATGTWSSGTRTFTPNASESWQAHVLRVRAGEFDASTPIGAADTRASAGTAETSMLSPAYSAGSTDGGGRLVMYGAVDDDPVIANASAWSTLATADLGAVSGTLAARNLETTNSESIAAGDWRIASDSWCTLAYIIRKPAAVGPTGTLSVTESGPDTIAAAGAVQVQGAFSAGESGNDTAALAGVVVVAGAFAASEAGPDTAAMSGAIPVSGALAVSEVGNDTAAISGGQVATGSLNATELGSDSAASAGTVLVQGGLTVSEGGSDTASVAGKVVVQGGFAALESGSDTAASSGVVLVQGALSVAESGPDVLVATGSLSGGITGSLNATESGSDKIVSTGAIVVTGVFSATEAGADSAAVAGAVRVQGSLVATEAGPDTFLAMGSAPPEVNGILAAIEQGSDSAALSGAILVAGLLAASEHGSDTALFIGTEDVPETYPLAGRSQGFPLAGQAQTYPLAR